MGLLTKWLGNRGERLAQKFLKRKGYRIAGTNVTTQFGEIDIVAEHNQTLVFIEVKALNYSDTFTPQDHYNYHKQRKQILLAKHYLSRLHRDVPARFDLITVIKKGRDFFIEHYEDVIHE